MFYYLKCSLWLTVLILILFSHGKTFSFACSFIFSCPLNILLNLLNNKKYNVLKELRKQFLLLFFRSSHPQDNKFESNLSAYLSFLIRVAHQTPYCCWLSLKNENVPENNVLSERITDVKLSLFPGHFQNRGCG